MQWDKAFVKCFWKGIEVPSASCLLPRAAQSPLGRMLIPTRKPDPQPSWSRRGDGESSPPVEPLHFCSRVKGVLWGNIPLALPQPASTLNSQEKHSSSPALAFTGISWGAFLKPCPSPRQAPWGRIPSARLSLFLAPHLPSSLSLPFLESCLPLQSSISAINSTDRIRDTRQSIPMCSLSALQWSRLKCMERCYTSARQGGDNGRHWSCWHVTSFSFSLSVGRGRHAARISLDFIKSKPPSCCETCVLLQNIHIK